MATKSQQKSWETSKLGHCYLTEDRGKWVFILYDEYKSPYSQPVVSGKRDTVESAMAAARQAASKNSIVIGTWANLTMTI